MLSNRVWKVELRVEDLTRFPEDADWQAATSQPFNQTVDTTHGDAPSQHLSDFLTSKGQHRHKDC
ncbi:hypothetical protein [Prosthecobacter sp.]|uniref:hypothetical protein n=1 Tax=Prosthecobacter sp. TaxID=1965333 RepID=UPI0037852AFA